MIIYRFGTTFDFDMIILQKLKNIDYTSSVSSRLQKSSRLLIFGFSFQNAKIPERIAYECCFNGLYSLTSAQQ